VVSRLFVAQVLVGSNPTRHIINIKGVYTMTQNYKTVVLDESILDIESWLPQEAIDEIVQAIINYETKLEQENKKQ
jgi:hypothetical protein